MFNEVTDNIFKTLNMIRDDKLEGKLGQRVSMYNSVWVAGLLTIAAMPLSVEPAPYTKVAKDVLIGMRRLRIDNPTIAEYVVDHYLQDTFEPMFEMVRALAKHSWSDNLPPPTQPIRELEVELDCTVHPALCNMAPGTLALWSSSWEKLFAMIYYKSDSPDAAIRLRALMVMEIMEHRARYPDWKASLATLVPASPAGAYPTTLVQVRSAFYVYTACFCFCV